MCSAGQNGELGPRTPGAVQATIALTATEKPEKLHDVGRSDGIASAKMIIVGALIAATSFDQS
ncbi:MAG: hypothetical protein DMG05_11020 [Acidobacteria bacterium]|nr:MAG: hypothetical protein DMG05_11020 [Acidobacteriota bacterium]